MLTRRQAAAAAQNCKENIVPEDVAAQRLTKRGPLGEIGNRMHNGAIAEPCAPATKPMALEVPQPAQHAAGGKKRNSSAMMDEDVHRRQSISSIHNRRDVEMHDGTTNGAQSPTSAAVANYFDSIPAADRPDLADPRFVAEYVHAIFLNMRGLEGKYQAPADYLARTQSDINDRMRAVLMDWLVEVHYKFKLYPETLFLCVSLLDRFLARCPDVPRSQLQLVGVTCLLIASKYEDIYAPEIKDIVHICDRTYRKEEILAMEVKILNTLQFEITAPSPLLFLLRLGKAMKCDEKHFYLAQYCLELALPDYKLWLRYSPSVLASGALYLSNKLLRLAPAWPANVMASIDHAEASVKACAKELCLLLQQPDESGAPVAGNHVSLRAVRKKFSQPKFHSVAKLVL